MKSILFLILTNVVALPALGQSYVNPTNTQDSGDIVLHHTDVYYCPYMPPDSNDSRDSLSCMETVFSDPNGVGIPGAYTPITHDSVLAIWQPCGTPLGPYATWQRFFTANPKPGGAPSDLIAGGDTTDTVTISKNEDVDFRASGTVKLENGFHAMPGSFFHAYQAPQFDSVVFSDEFDSTALDRTKWYVGLGHGDVNAGAQCSSDSDVRDTLDPDAYDGHALDVMLVEDTDTCYCLHTAFNVADTCKGDILADTSYKFLFSAANIRSCPWPFAEADSPFTQTYQHGPYGKYEIREKIPHIMHHTNNWGANQFEWDMGETYNGDMTERHGGFVLSIRCGSFKGKFGRGFDPTRGDTVAAFRSSQANFSNVNCPVRLIINNFLYTVNCNFTPTDTFLTATSTSPVFPSSLASAIDSFSFDYIRNTSDTTDTLTWTVSTDGGGNWRLFSAPYHDSLGIPLYFSKDYQPTQITLTYDVFRDHYTTTCHWDYSSGKIWLDNPVPGPLHSNTEAYSYTIDDGAAAYRIPPIQFDGNDTTGGYVYHTYTMELLPHELRYLIDGNVVRRFPDRLVPPSSPFFDRMSSVFRNGTYLYPAEFEIDASSPPDPYGTTPGSPTYIERQYFESHLHNPGMWDVEIPAGSGHWYHAAHHLIDYIKIWDVPSNVFIPPFPN